MPSPRDLTGDLVRLRTRKSLDEAVPVIDTRSATPRKMAFDPILWLSGALILVGLAIEGAFILWLW